ncbi:MAG: site-2 protease family protein [Chloroflexi bacterium]|nr:site-2 protease family protein [Chloroflexota bacterium]
MAWAVAVVIALSVHELSHGLVANWLGDPTPKRQGRLTLNPIAHMDPIGTALLFLVGFGWAKPVQVNPLNLRVGEKWGMALVGAAGPISNLVAAGIFTQGLLLVRGPIEELLFDIVAINIILAIFNLIPLPPLDGFHVALGVLPQDLSNTLARLRAYGPVMLIGLLALDNLTGLNFLGRTIGPAIDLFLRVFTWGAFS